MSERRLRALQEEIEHRRFCEGIIDFLEIEAIRKL